MVFENSDKWLLIHFVSAYLLVNNGLEKNTQVSCVNVKYLELSHL